MSSIEFERSLGPGSLTPKQLSLAMSTEKLGQCQSRKVGVLCDEGSIVNQCEQFATGSERFEIEAATFRNFGFKRSSTFPSGLHSHVERPLYRTLSSICCPFAGSLVGKVTEAMYVAPDLLRQLASGFIACLSLYVLLLLGGRLFGQPGRSWLMWGLSYAFIVGQTVAQWLVPVDIQVSCWHCKEENQ